jgi:hypothetical protein
VKPSIPTCFSRMAMPIPANPAPTIKTSLRAGSIADTFIGEKESCQGILRRTRKAQCIKARCLSQLLYC